MLRWREWGGRLTVLVVLVLVLVLAQMLVLVLMLMPLFEIINNGAQPPLTKKTSSIATLTPAPSSPASCGSCCDSWN